MKKITAAVLCIISALSLFGCGKNSLKPGEESTVTEGTGFDVSMTIVEGTVTPSKATVLVTNNTDIEIDSGNEYDFSIEVLDKGKWKAIETDERDNTAEALIFTGESELVLDWKNIYGALPKGHYRIVKSFFPWTENGIYGIDDQFYLTAEFSIE